MTLTQIFRAFVIVTILALFTLLLLNSGTWGQGVDSAPTRPTPLPTLSGKNTPSSAIVLAESEIDPVHGLPFTVPELSLTIDRSHGAYLLVDDDGDKFICEIVPQDNEDMGDCIHVD